MTDNGWRSSETFYQYIVNVYHPWLKEQKIELPMYLDGHSSYFTLPLNKFSKQNQIILIALFPNTTHVIQPLDRTLFRPLKKSWAQSVDDFKYKNSSINIKKEDFGNVLNDAVSKLDVKAIMKTGFEVSGLFPFNPDKVNYDLLKYRNENSNDNTKGENSLDLEKEESECEQALESIKKKLDASFIELFTKAKRDGVWLGDIEMKALFEL